MLTLIKEDGSGLVSANTYALVADGTAYFEGRLYSDVWFAANSAKQGQALVMATRLIDVQMQFNGYKRSQNQALQWPRWQCPDPDSSEQSILSSDVQGPYLPETSVPKAVIDATCEMALSLLKGDRTGDPSGGPGGVSELEIAGAVRVKFENDSTPTLPDDVADMLWKYGVRVGANSSGGVVKLVRV